MRNILVSICISVLIVLTSCSTTQVEVSEPNQQLKDLVESQSFEIISDWAKPLATTGMNYLSNQGLLAPGSTATQINIAQITNYVRITKDSAAVALPYYGERRTGNSLGDDNGINFTGKIEDYSAVYNTKKSHYLVEFKMSDRLETYDVQLKLYNNLTSGIHINSSRRTSISYTGDIKPLEDKQ